METLSPIQRFWKLLKPDKLEIRNIYAYAFFSGIVSLSLPLGIQAIVNLIQGGQVSTSWIVLVVFVVMGVAFTGVLQILQLRIMENLQQKIFTRAAFEFSFRMPRIKLESLYPMYGPELMNRFFDIVSIQKGLSKLLIDFTGASLQVFFGLLLLCFYHPFFIIFSMILLLIILLIFKLTGKRGLETSLSESGFKYRIANWLEELARSATTFKLAGNSELPMFKTNELVTKYLHSRESHFKILMQQYSLMVVFKVLVATGLLGIGGYLVIEQAMNIGQFIAAEIIVLLIMNSVEKLILNFANIYDILTSLAKVGQVTDLELEPEGGIDLQDKVGAEPIELIVENVSFKYPNNETPILSNISFKLNKNESAILSGTGNSGKSTLLFVLSGLYRANSGSVCYNDLPQNSIEICSLRKTVGDSLGQESLFEGTILENITCGVEGIEESNVTKTLNDVCLDDYIKKLPKGIYTDVGTQGSALPKSIIQKIIIARAIVNYPKLVLLDNPFEGIHEMDRKRIIDFLTDKSNKWTLLIASNDDYLKSKVDKILELENGELRSH